jgi:acetyl-CoA carboxylase biotin carboxylase subunit
MGDKVQARQTVAAAAVPVVQGSSLSVGSPEEARAIAAEIGYPVIIKAAAGGGGRGMRIVQAEADLAKALEVAQGEAGVAFGNPAVYIERYIRNPRHVEFQILADAHGEVLHLGERDCSIQRRHQKLIEESPSPGMTPTLRDAMGKAAVASARAAGYVNAGTIEFLLDEDGRFYFMEMNTRIQVEHPVTEEVVGLDLVKQQLCIAAVERVPLRQEEVVLRGHAIECRVNAEDPEEFLPSPGKITTLRLPGGPGVRVDTHAYAGYTIPPYYDSLIGKLIVRGQDRAEAIARMRRALQEFVVQGIKTTIPFHLRVMDHPDFVKGAVSTNFLERLSPASQ